jgi:hypothetical protein
MWLYLRPRDLPELVLRLLGGALYRARFPLALLTAAAVGYFLRGAR